MKSILGGGTYKDKDQGVKNQCWEKETSIPQAVWGWVEAIPTAGGGRVKSILGGSTCSDNHKDQGVRQTRFGKTHGKPVVIKYPGRGIVLS